MYTRASRNDSQGADFQQPEPSYFSSRSKSPYSSAATTPQRSRVTTPSGDVDEQSQLLTPSGRPKFFRFSSKTKVPSLAKPASQDKGKSKLQVRWRGGDRRLNSSDSTYANDSASETEIAVPLAKDYISTAVDLSPTESISSNDKKLDSKNPETTFDDSPILPSIEDIAADDDDVPIKSTADVHDEEAVRRPVITQDFAMPTSGAHAIPLPPLSRQSSAKWADRLRQRSSASPLPRTSSTSCITSVALPTLAVPQPVKASTLARSNSAFSSTPDLRRSFSTSLRSQSQSRPASRNLDEAIDFDRIRSPAPLSRSVSVVDLHNPFSDSREILVEQRDAQPNLHPYVSISPEGSSQSSDSLNTSVDIESESDDESDDEYDEELGPPPDVPPALEYVDPEIECVAPSASTATLPLAEQQLLDQPEAQHPWTTPPYNIVEREPPSFNRWIAGFKISISLGVVISLLVGYGLRLKIVRVGPWSFGMYGLLLVVDFIVQTIAASFNRRSVVKVTKASPIVKAVAERLEVQDQLPLTNPKPLPECSIAVVGYREDEEAWTACLKSLQAQEYPIKHIIGVVDGNDGPDLDMANAFGKAFPEEQRLISHLPVLLSVMYKEKYWEHMNSLAHPPLTRWEHVKMWFTQKSRPGQQEAHEVAWNHMLNYVHSKATEERWADWKGICFSQPHGHKRHAMFTAFVVGAYALGTKDAMLTTDSDTYVYPDAVKNMMALLFSDSRLAGVTGDVRIWNKSDSFLALMSSIRYWFAFNVERACQSAFGCVGCLSGPLGLYKCSDLMSVLGPWILQTFLGKETTFGDDRHLTNRILSLGHKTGYTQLAMCDSDTPAGYVRWVKQQTRWSKSFFREAYWFPKSFAYHRFWLTVETTKQFLYPMVLTATVVSMLYKPSSWIRPLIWLATMFGVALIKSIYGVICLRDPRQFLFGVYGVMYFFGLLPSKLFACFTVHITNWGTSARSKSEFARPESFLSRTTHIGHLVVWYLVLTIGLAYFLATIFHQPLFWFVGILGGVLTFQAYSDVIIGETKYGIYMLRKKMKERREARVSTEDVDVEKVAGKKSSKRLGLKKLRRGKRAEKEKQAISIAPVTAEDGASEVAVPESETGPEVILGAPDARVSIVTPTLENTSAEPATSHTAPPTIFISLPPSDEREDYFSQVFTEPRKVSLASSATAVDTGISRRPSLAPTITDVADSRKVSVASTSTMVDSELPMTPAEDRKMGLGAIALAKSINARLGRSSGNGGKRLTMIEDVEGELPFTPGAMVVY
ncbi:glycosyltransferase family 2 protein [Laetiporus sulphureus 93-53]|uniref:Glycosyltransferase family 2 protein n=1 Tax=Laetiporus sulphureus 93-53 TaxID=1314785 RepID=A0A165CRN7_9APHY|nr:glycosyltransferase family 2 protein [Laetiporus sulphureus 93-53]KZT03310.1 glycosyltransferase family 2 protein [Laetiporus sulphureus 93-53]